MIIKINKSRKRKPDYIQKYKEMKEQNIILWNVNGKRKSESLSKWQKYKINRAYEEYKALGPRSRLIYPAKKRGETQLAYKRRINKIKRENGLDVSDISGIVLDADLAKTAKIKGNKIITEMENKTLKYIGHFLAINPLMLFTDDNESVALYLHEVIEEGINKFDLKPLDTVYPMHGAYKGQGNFIKYTDDLIDTLINWAMEYRKNTDKQFLTGFYFEKIIRKQ